MPTEPSGEVREETLEERVLRLEWLVGVIASQIAEPPHKSRPANDQGRARIVRPATRTEIQSDVQSLLQKFGLDDIDFRVL